MRSAADVRDLRQRLQQIELANAGAAAGAEQERARAHRIAALEEQVARLTAYVRSSAQ
jgi:hypothetical protein